MITLSTTTKIHNVKTVHFASPISCLSIIKNGTHIFIFYYFLLEVRHKISVSTHLHIYISSSWYTWNVYFTSSIQDHKSYCLTYLLFSAPGAKYIYQALSTFTPLNFSKAHHPQSGNTLPPSLYLKKKKTT